MKYVSLQILLTIIGIFFSSGIPAQHESGFFKVKGPVKLWIITHPFSACNAKRIAEKARIKTNELRIDQRLDGLENGGQLDAFRHAYWMALTSQKYNCRRAFRLGRAHEKGNRIDFIKGNREEGELPDSVSVAMDLHNNCKGVYIGFENPEATEEELAAKVIDKILKGEMLIINRNSGGVFVDCEGKLIEAGEWKGIWNNRRCLIRSDYKPLVN